MSVVPGEAPAPRRRRGLPVIGVVVAVAVIAAGGAVAAVTLLSRGDSPQTAARQAGQAIAAAAGVTLTGSMAGTTTAQPARLTVTRAGAVTGTYTQAGGKVTLITIAGTTFLNAPAAFWRNQGTPFGDTSSSAGGRWALASPADGFS
jgi:hypothetical protein